jgi:DNA polymerase III alpha subunit
MYKDKVGFPVFNSKDIFDIIYQGKSDSITELLVEDSDEIQKFNSFSENQLTIYNLVISDESDITAIDKQLQSFWFMPEEYTNIELGTYLLSKCNTREEKVRVIDELAEYNRRGLRMLLRFLIYLVDFMREHNIVWGVGRGSSVASYVLYLIGIHKIDSIKYDLDFHEFMR